MPMSGPTGAARAELVFFRNLACLWALVIVAGFVTQLLAGRSSFASPLIVHIHAFTFFGWVALFVTQSVLISGGNAALHRRLGWLALFWPPLMVVVGITVMLHAMEKDGGPFFFGAAEFMFANPLSLITFAALVYAALIMRRRSDWHRRLMLSAVAMISGPGFGRLLPSPLLAPYAWPIINLVGLGFIIAGMARDRRHHGAIHPAWWVGLAAGLGWILVGEVVASTQWAQDTTRAVIAGTPGANRPMGPYRR